MGLSTGTDVFMDETLYGHVYYTTIAVRGYIFSFAEITGTLNKHAIFVCSVQNREDPQKTHG